MKELQPENLPEPKEQPSRFSSEPRTLTTKILRALARVGHKFTKETALPTVKRSGFFRRDIKNMEGYGTRQQKAFLQDHPNFFSLTHSQLKTLPRATQDMWNELSGRAQSEKKELYTFLSENINDEYVGLFLDVIIEEHQVIVERGTTYIKEVLVPQFKKDFTKRISELSRSNTIPLSYDEIEKRLAGIETLVFERPGQTNPFTNEKSKAAPVAGYATTQLKLTALQIDTDGLMYAAQEAIGGNTDKEWSDRLKKTYFHEMVHAIAGQTWRRVADFPLQLVHRSGMDFDLPDDTDENNHDHPDHSHSRLMWLNEAITEGFTQYILSENKDDSPNLFINLESSYSDERKLLQLLVQRLGIDQQLLLDAYFENYDETMPKNNRLAAFKKLMRHIGTQTEPGFLMKLENLVKQRGVVDAKKDTEYKIDAILLRSRQKKIKLKIDQLNFSEVWPLDETDFKQSEGAPQPCKEVKVPRMSGGGSEGWNWFLHALRESQVSHKFMTIDDALDYIKKHPALGTVHPVLCPFIDGNTAVQKGPRKFVPVIMPDGAGGRKLIITRLHEGREWFYRDNDSKLCANVLVKV